VQWSVDTASRQLNELERLVWRVIGGLRELRVTAELSGTVKAPRLAVSSNLDQAVSARLQAVIGEEVARAEQRVRAEVDKLVSAQIEAARQRVSVVETDGRQRIEAERKQLDAVEQELRAQLKRLTAGIQIPGIRLP
jgi:autotransporter translocation and assembly factor TamB